MEQFAEIKDPRTAVANNFIGVDVRYDKRIDQAHHRTEIREVWTVPVAAIGQLDQPKIGTGLQSLVMVVRVRHLLHTDERHREQQQCAAPAKTALADWHPDGPPKPVSSAFWDKE